MFDFDTLLHDVIVARRLMDGAGAAARLAEARDASRSLAEVIEPHMAEEDLARALGRASDLSPVLLDGIEWDGATAARLRELLSFEIASHYGIVPVGLREGALHVGATPPQEPDMCRELAALAGTDVEVFAACPGRVADAIERLYGAVPEADGGVEPLDDAEIEASSADGGVSAAEPTEVSAPVSGYRGPESDDGDFSPLERLLHLLVMQGLVEGADAIRLEPDGARLRVRYRHGDGFRDGISPPARMQAALLAHLARGAGIAGRSSAGHFAGVGRLKVDGLKGPETLRVEMTQTSVGAAAVLFPGADSPPASRLDDLSLDGGVAALLDTALRRPRGMVLVAGPPDGGPAAVRHALLGEAADRGLAVVSLEAVPEAARAGVLRLPRRLGGVEIAQALALDPDVLGLDRLAGREDLVRALGAASSGRLVVVEYGGLDAVTVLARMRRELAEEHPLMGAVLAALATRTVGRLCPGCRVAVDPPGGEEPPAAAGVDASASGAARMAIPGPGCSMCRGGYLGHRLLVEALSLDDEIAKRLAEGAGVPSLREAALAAGARTFARVGWGQVSAQDLALADLGP